ncbi:MAG: glycosyltransferase [Rhodothermales bacterium]
MKFLIATIGSRGDVQPYVALGKGLKAAGHDVTVCTSVRFEAFVAEHGLAYAYLNDDLLAILDTVEGQGIFEDMGGLFSGIKTGVRLVKDTGPIQRSLLQEGWQAAVEVEPDLIVYNSKMGGAPHYADKLGIPVVLAVPFPQFVPTKSFPSLGFPNWKLGAWYNRATYRIVLAIAERIGGKYVREWRSAHDLPPEPPGADILHRSDGSRIPVLHAFSRHVVPEPPDWPEEAITTGYWFLDRHDEWEPPADLERFLKSGDPPVYVGFGSMSGRKPERTARIVTAALQQADLRGVLATGWGGMKAQAIPSTVFLLDHAPHDWLFPRMSAVVHHGGAGTTAAGLRAGCPTVICPFFGDQPFWGRRVHDLGLGSAPIPQKKLTAETLAAALREVTTNHTIRQRAEEIGEKIRSEDGVARAVAVIENMAGP